MPKHDHLHKLPITERYPEEVWDAVNFAAHAHETQIRKLSGNHYIIHPFSVLNIVREVVSDRTDGELAVQKAAVLHDTVEDTTVTFRDLKEEFDDLTAKLVWGVTKDDTISDWRERNEAYLYRLEYEALEGSVVIALADKIHNITDMIENHKLYGDKMWTQFNAQADDQLWWYTSVKDLAVRRVPGNPLIEQLDELLYEFKIRVIGARTSHAASIGV